MQRGPLRPRSRTFSGLLQRIKCTHGGLSMPPAAGLTLKMRESKAWDRVKCWFGIRPTWPKGRQQGRGTSPRALSKLKAAADEQERWRIPEADRAASSLIFTNVEINFCCHFQHFSHLTDPLTGSQRQAVREGRPGTRNRIHYGLAQLICIACHMPNKQTTISNGLLVISRFDFCDVKFLCFVCVFLFALIFIEFIARRVATSPAGGAAACASCGSCQLASVAFRQARVAQKFKDTEVLSLSPFSASLVSKGELELCLGLATRKE